MVTTCFSGVKCLMTGKGTLVQATFPGRVLIQPFAESTLASILLYNLIKRVNMKASPKIILSVSILLTVFGLVSCKKYLDRPLEASISEKEVFANFRSFQGFTEELYSCLPDMSKSTWNNEW